MNDGSTDATCEVLERIVRGGRASVLDLEANAGKAEAVRRGVLEALRGDAEAVGYWDADLAAPLTELDAMIEALFARDAFLVIGSRVRMLGRRVERSSVRHYLGRVFATAASCVLDLPVYDTQCGAKVMRSEELAREIFGEPFESRWIFDVEILVRIALHDRRAGTTVLRERVVEHPLGAWSHVSGSRLKVLDFGRAALDLARISRGMGRSRPT